MRTSGNIFPHHVFKFTNQVAIHTLGQQEEMEMFVTSRGDFTELENSGSEAVTRLIIWSTGRELLLQNMRRLLMIASQARHDHHAQCG